VTQEELIKLLRDQGYTPQDLMKAGVGMDGYTKGVGVLQNDIDIFDINQDGRVSSLDSLLYNKSFVQERQEEQFQEPSSLANPLTTAAEDPFNDYEDLNKDGIVTQEELDESGRLEEEDFYNSPYYQSMDFPKYFDPATGETQYEEIYSELLNGAAYTKNDGSFNLIDAWKNWSGSGKKKRIEQEASYVYDRVVNDATMYGEEAYFDGHIAQQFYQGEGGYGSSNTFGVGGSSYANRFTDRQIFNYLVAAEGIETKKDFDPTPFFEGVDLPEGSEIRQGVGLKGPYASNYSAIKLRDDERGGNVHRIDTNPSAPIGSYTIVDIFVPDPPDPTLLENVTALMDMVSFVYPPLKLISTAIKVVDGQEISAMDIIGSIGVGMDLAGITPPDFGLDSIEFEAAVQADVDKFIDINSGILDRVGGIAEVEKFEAATRSAILAQQVLPPNFADFTNPVVDGFLDINLDADKTIGVMDIIDMAEGVVEATKTPPAFDIDGVPTGAMGTGVIVNFGSAESLGNYNPVKDKYTGETIISDGYGNTISEIGQVINAAGDVIRQLDKESSQNLSEATINTVRDNFVNSEEWVNFNAVSPDVQDGQVNTDGDDIPDANQTVVDIATGEIVFSSQPDLPEGEDEIYEIDNSVVIEADPVLITDPSDSEGGGVGGTSEATDEGVLLRQLYEAASEESDENLREDLINEYIKLGGIFGDALREGVPYDTTYPNSTDDEEEQDTTFSFNPDGTYTIVDNATGEIIYESNPATDTGEEEDTNIPITYPDYLGEVADGPDPDLVINKDPLVTTEPSDGGDDNPTVVPSDGGDSTVITEPSDESDGDGSGSGSGSGSGDGDGDGNSTGDRGLSRTGLLANRTTEGLFGAELSKFKEPDFSYDEIQDYIRKRYA